MRPWENTSTRETRDLEGYLSYDRQRKDCGIPNFEVAGEMQNAVEDTNWTNIVEALQQSEQLLQATLEGNAEAVAQGVDAMHDEETSILSYNNENSMACVLSIAYYYARNNYIIHRELASGKGFADLVLLPRKNVSSPALVLELKYDKNADTAIEQIKRKKRWRSTLASCFSWASITTRRRRPTRASSSGGRKSRRFAPLLYCTKSVSPLVQH